MDLTDIILLRAGIACQIADADLWPTWRDKQKLEVFRELVSGKFTDEQIAHSYFKLPTGYGKTVLFARMARAYFDALTATGNKKHQKIIIIVPRLPLIGQTQKELEKFANITATEFSGKKKDSSSDVIITTYNSLVKLFDVIDFNDVAMIFADEAHHMLGEKISEQLTFYSQYVPIIGFTATPKYEANRAIANMLNTEIYAMNIPEAVDSGVLCPVKNILYRSSIVCDLSLVPATGNGDYDYEKITTQISPDTLATEIAHVYAEGFDEQTGIEFRTLKAIINCPNAAIANLQAAKINEIMGREVAISLHKVGIGDKEYDRLKGEFQYGDQYTVACQVGTLTEGFDDKTVALCINYPTRSRVKAEQTAGRALRIDENNEYKFAFVIDTLFRSTPDARDEDILYTASNSHQVLFKDIAGGNAVLDPKKIQEKLAEQNSARIHKHRNVEFVDYKLITDSATLIELNRATQERLDDEFIPEKTDVWLSANDLVKDKDFPSGTREKINNALDKFEHDPDFEGFIRDMKSGGFVVKCIHESKKQLFAEKAGFKYYPPKTDEWMSVNDLVKDKNFPSSSWEKINNALDKFEHDPDFEGFIRDMKTKTMVTKCIHESKKQLFAERAGFKYYPPKTDEWMSAEDLAKDKKFPSGSPRIINTALNNLQHNPEFKEFIQDMKTGGGMVCKCIHVSKKQVFAERAGFKDYPQKTDEWLSVVDLRKDKTFPSVNDKKIGTALADLQYDPEFKGFILNMQAGSQVALCIHVSKKQAFAERAGFKDYPQKTDEWLSIEDLRKDEEFAAGSYPNIKQALEKLQYDPEFKGFIQEMNSSGHIIICLHISKKQAFAERSGFKVYPLKTDEWLSPNDLLADKDFPSGRVTNIKQALEKLQYNPEFRGFIQKMKSSGHVIICLHISKKQAFAERSGFKVYPLKTDEWLSANDLSADPNFPISSKKVILKNLQDLQPYMPNLIQQRQANNGQAPLCLHRDGREKFLKLVKQQSLQDGTKVVDTMSAVQDIENSIKPDDQHHI